MTSRQANASAIVGLGVCCEDRLALTPRWPRTDEGVHLRSYTRQCGGMVATALAAAQNLGVSTSFAGMAGADRSGRWLKAELTRQGIDTSQFVLRQGFPTPFSIIVVQQRSGHRRIFHYRPVEFNLQPREIDFSALTRARFLHLDGHHLGLSCEAATLARKNGIPVCLDASYPYPDIDSLLPFVDYLICNRHFPLQITGKKQLRPALEKLAGFGARLVVATLGDKGGLYWLRGEFRTYPAYQVAMVDSTGAGDVFHGAFLAALCKGRHIPQALQYASAAAALSCRALGGQGALPTHTEVLALLRSPDGRRRSRGSG